MFFRVSGGLQGYGSYGKGGQEMTMEQGAAIYEVEMEEDEAEVVRQLAERLSSEESPEAKGLMKRPKA